MRLKPLRASVSAIAISLTLANCTTIGNANNPCGDRIWACVIAGAGVLAAIIYIGFYSDYEDGGSGPGSPGYVAPSDARLKKDIRPAGILPNGIKLYSFRYWNDERLFVGVLAQDLLADARFRHAVKTDANGYYVVDLKAIGLGIDGDAAQLLAAGQAALKAATPL
jgi:hypothetical protein